MELPRQTARSGTRDPTGEPVGPAPALRVELVPPVAGTPGGPLAGTTFVVKDSFDVAGHRSGCGHPAWLEQVKPAARNATAVERVLRAGAALAGKAHLDELAFSLSGTNAHYGTPPNPVAPDREPGGSSSGCASALASGLVDLALGSDTAGSARVPASFCGLLGFRPTHGRVPVDGLAPLAPSFDAVGWLARSGELLERAGLALLAGHRVEPASTRILVPRDARALLGSRCGDAFDAALERAACGLGAQLTPVELGAAGSGLGEWSAAFRTLQGREAWRCWGAWLTRRRPRLGPGVAARFAYAAELTLQQEREATAVGAAARARLAQLLAPDALLAIPTAVGPALPLAMDRATKDARRRATLLLTTLAPLAGAPAVSLPLAAVDGLPLGVTLMAARGADEGLLAAARTLVP